MIVSLGGGVDLVEVVVTHTVVMQHNHTSNMSESIIYCVDKIFYKRRLVQHRGVY